MRPSKVSRKRTVLCSRCLTMLELGDFQQVLYVGEPQGGTVLQRPHQVCERCFNEHCRSTAEGGPGVIPELVKNPLIEEV